MGPEDAGRGNLCSIIYILESLIIKLTFDVMQSIVPEFGNMLTCKLTVNKHSGLSASEKGHNM